MEKRSGLVILDRDGVINHERDDFVKSPAEWQPIAGSLEAIAALHRAGFRVAVATNQSGIARGLFSLLTLEMIHEKMRCAVADLGGELAEIAFCPSLDADHPDRKPNPGLLLQLQRQFQPSACWFVGDSRRDLDAAQRAGIPALLVRTGRGEHTWTQTGHEPAFADLAAAANWIIAQTPPQ